VRARAIVENGDITFVLKAVQFHVWPIGAPLPDAVATMHAVYRQLGIARCADVTV
jgi:hypothetical protein